MSLLSLKNNWQPLLFESEDPEEMWMLFYWLQNELRKVLLFIPSSPKGGLQQPPPTVFAPVLKNAQARDKIAPGTFKGCGMGPWLVLVSLCFRQNIVAICKTWSFLCSLDNLLQKNVIVFFFLEIKFENGARLKKRAILTYFLHF